MSDYTYFVSGRAYTRLYGSTAEAMEWPGLIDTISLSVTQNVISLPDRTNSGGGVYKEIRRIDSVALTMNHREFDPDTLARAFYGTQSLVTGASIVDEEHTIKRGSFIPLAHPGKYTAVAVTDDEVTPNTIDPVNYEVRPAGLWIPSDAPNLVDDDIIRVSYTHPSYNRVEALNSSPPELEIFFEGINEAVDDNPAPARIHRVRFGPAEELQLLSGDDFGSLSLIGEVLKDLTITGTGISQYMYMDVPVPV